MLLLSLLLLLLLLLWQRGEKLGLTGRGGGLQPESVAGCREALRLRCERAVQDITDENNAIHMQSIQNWASGSKSATIAKLQLQHFLSTEAKCYCSPERRQLSWR